MGSFVAYASLNDWEVYVARSVDNIANATRMTQFNSVELPNAEVDTIQWKNNEGDIIEGLLYFPPGKKGTKGLPFIVNIHGGPWAAVTNPYYVPLAPVTIDLARVLASRGYLVLSPNYRGSTGRGDDFLKSLDGFPCSRPTADVLSGVDYVVAQGWADPERLGIRGGSYGGRVTNCAIGVTTRFKAAVAVAAFWNLTSAFSDSAGWSGGMESPAKSPWEDIKMFWDESPISRTDKIKTPTLIMSGGDDTTVSPAQARAQHDCLNEMDVPNVLLEFPRVGHTFGAPSVRIAMLEAELAWFDHYLLGKPLPPPGQITVGAIR